jgi:hypothetical protein
MGCMKGFDAPSSSSYKTILKGGAKKNLKYQYEGSWDNDHPHGFGVYRYFESGDRYEGNFIEGKRHGLGIFLWGNGDKYTGNFENGNDRSTIPCIIVSRFNKRLFPLPHQV